MLFLLLVLVCTVQTTLAQCLVANDVPLHLNRPADQELKKGQMDFSLKLLKAVGSMQPSDNMFMSPISVFYALLLAYFSSSGHTEVSLKKTLGLPKHQDKLNFMYTYRLQKQVAHFSEEFTSQVNIANHLFISQDQVIRDCMADLFYSEIEEVDFTMKGLSNTVDRINSWVANETRNNIQSIISPGSLNPNSQMVLANVAYFKGMWKHEFEGENTREGKFYVSKSKSVPVPMMYQQSTFSHWRSDKIGAEILELPYRTGNISFIIFMPDPSNDTYPALSVLKRLDSDTLVGIIREAADPKFEDEVEVKLPKFIVERSLELSSVLENIGVGDLFKSTSDLTGLTGGPKITLNSAVHKAKIQVDERGTEAAAATALTDSRFGGNPFTCDHPFLYMLYDKGLEILLFAGILNDPTK